MTIREVLAELERVLQDSDVRHFEFRYTPNSAVPRGIAFQCSDETFRGSGDSVAAALAAIEHELLVKESSAARMRDVIS